MSDVNTNDKQTTLWLIPTPLDFGTEPLGALEYTIPNEVIQQAVQIKHWIVENAKTARAVLKRMGEVFPLNTPLQEMQIIELPREVHKKGDVGFDARPLLKQLLQGVKLGADIGLMSEAGLPAIADPGSSVVRAAHALGVQVRPMVGPSSLLLALMGSGLNGQNFAFVGYLPKTGPEQVQRIKELEKFAKKQTQLFIETPYRNDALLKALLHTLQPHTILSVAFGISLPNYKQVSLKVSDWKSSNLQQLGLNEATIKLPAVFLLG